jgi:hypothetical protein
MSKRYLATELDCSLGGKITGLPNPTNPQDAATKAYVDAGIEGISWKTAVRVATQSNINLSSAPATIDGVTLVVNDRVLVKEQSTASENGIYIYNGSGSAMTRALDANTGAELTNAVVTVNEGTSAGTTWRQTTVNPTLGTDNIVWTQFGTSVADASETQKGIIQIATQSEVDAGTNDTKAVTPLKLKSAAFLLRKYSVTFGDTSNTTYTITHNLGTQDWVAHVRRTSDGYPVDCHVRPSGDNTATVVLGTAPGNNALRITIVG